MPGTHALTLCLHLRCSRAVHACGALRLVGGCTSCHNNVGGVTAGQVTHNSSGGNNFFDVEITAPRIAIHAGLIGVADWLSARVLPPVGSVREG